MKLHILAVYIANTNYIASTVGVSTDSARGKEYFSSKLNRIKFNWRGMDQHVIVF